MHVRNYLSSQDTWRIIVESLNGLNWKRPFRSSRSNATDTGRETIMSLYCCVCSLKVSKCGCAICHSENNTFPNVGIQYRCIRICFSLEAISYPSNLDSMLHERWKEKKVTVAFKTVYNSICCHRNHLKIYTFSILTFLHFSLH